MKKVKIAAFLLAGLLAIVAIYAGLPGSNNPPRVRNFQILNSVLIPPGPVDLITECNDGIDNDNDTLIDYPEDTGCQSANDTTETSGECDDGIDNDGDLHFDTISVASSPRDSGCTDPADPSESPKDDCQDSSTSSDTRASGRVYGWDNDIWFSYQDSCESATAKRQYSCYGPEQGYDYYSVVVNCPVGRTCTQGACV